MTVTASLDRVIGPEGRGTVQGLSLESTGATPQEIVAPSSPEECAEVMAWASKEGVGVLVVGHGAQLGPVSNDGPWIALSTNRLRGIEVYEAADLTITAGGGTPTSTIDAALSQNDQWLPFDPPRVREASLGGLVSSGWSGALWAGYGELRNHVLGATVVTGDGRVLRLGGRVVKNVAGFDLLKLIVGGRGRFGVITSLCLRAFPKPAVDRLLVAAAPRPSGLASVAAAVRTAPIVPASSTMVDRLPGSDAAGLVIRLHGSEETVDAEQRMLEAHLGVPLATVPFSDDFVHSVADRGADATVVSRFSLLPTSLTSILMSLEAASVSAMTVDAYGARGRVAFDSVESAEAAGLAEVLDEHGGALFVERAPAGSSLERSNSLGSPGEQELAKRLSSVFDPANVLWPARA